MHCKWLSFALRKTKSMASPRIVVFLQEKYLKKSEFNSYLDHGGLSQWGRSNRPRIRPGTVKSLNAPWELSQLALSRDYAKKIDPCHMLVWLGRRTVPWDWVNTHCYLAGQYKLGRSCSNSNLLQSSKLKTGYRQCMQLRNQGGGGKPNSPPPPPHLINSRLIMIVIHPLSSFVHLLIIS